MKIKEALKNIAEEIDNGYIYTAAMYGTHIGVSFTVAEIVNGDGVSELYNESDSLAATICYENDSVITEEDTEDGKSFSFNVDNMVITLVRIM